MTLLIIASWTFKEKSVFATLLRRYYFGSFLLCHETTHVTCKGTSEDHVKQKKDGLRLSSMRLCNAEKDLPKVNSTVVFLMHSEFKNLFHFYSSLVALGKICFVLVLISTNDNASYLYQEMDMSRTDKKG